MSMKYWNYQEQSFFSQNDRTKKKGGQTVLPNLKWYSYSGHLEDRFLQRFQPRIWR
jgi:hypothetical protein